MKSLGAGLAIALALWLAGGLQQAVAPKLAIAGAAPDFLLVALAAGSLFLNRAKGAILGFFCGLIHGALAGANLMHYVISRTVGGFFAAWSRTTTLEANLFLAGATGFFLTLVSQVLLMFLAPPPQLLPYLTATMIAAVYNGVLVLPVYFLLRKFVRPRS